LVAVTGSKKLEKGSKIWIDGKVLHWDEAKVHVLTHALHYGTGVFEGIRCYKTEDGPAIFRLYDHASRLINSAKIYLMDLRYSVDEIAEAIKMTVKANNLDECYIRPIAFCGYGEMGLNPLLNKVSLAIAAWPWGTYLGEQALKTGVRCMVSSWRRINASTLPPQAKSTANYANSALAKIEAIKAGYDEAILLNVDGMVSEATGENIFRVKRGALSTPPASASILQGITRDSVIQLANDAGLTCHIAEMSREELYTSDELFLCGTAAEITPVREVDGRTIGDGQFPVTRKLQVAYGDVVRGRNSNYSHWLEYVRQTRSESVIARSG